MGRGGDCCATQRMAHRTCAVLVAVALVSTIALVSSAEVEELDAVPEQRSSQAATVARRPPILRALFERDIDGDEADLDNGDDTFMIEEREGGPAKKAPATPKKPAAKLPGTPPTKKAAPATTKGAPSKKKAPTGGKNGAPKAAPAVPQMPKKGAKIPPPPRISKMDVKYMPSIMGKLMKMRKEMTNLKGANWMKILEAHRDGVVQIMVVKKQFMWKAAYRAPLSEQISGSGWFIDNKEFEVDTKKDLLVVTNAHVAKNAADINIMIPSLGQEPVAVEVVGLCSQRDIALLRVKNKARLLALYKAKTGLASIIKMRLGDSDKMKRGARCMAVGYPLGLKSVKASMGIVSGYQQFKSALYLQITAPINPGNSGGPLFNSNGQVVGINSAKIASASGMSFSIASVQLKVMLNVLYQRRQFVVPFLGYGYSVGTKLIQKYLKVQGTKDKSGGVYIAKVHPNGLFQSAGVKKGDLLLTVDGANIDRFGETWMPTMKDNINILGLLARKKIGSQLVLGVWRKSAGKLLSLHAKYDSTKPFAVPFVYEPLLDKPKYHIFAGVVFMELSVNLVTVMLQSNVAELIRFMKPENRLNPAVVVAGVLPGSVAGLDGSIRPGLIVKKVNGKPVNSMKNICGILANKPKRWYTISTSQTFTALKVSQVHGKKGGMSSRGTEGSFCDKGMKKKISKSATKSGTNASNNKRSKSPKSPPQQPPGKGPKPVPKKPATKAPTAKPAPKAKAGTVKPKVGTPKPTAPKKRAFSQ